MPVDDPKQNSHKWWGTITIDQGTLDENDAPSPLVGKKCVFVKTSYNSHFVSTGTIVKKIRKIADKQAAAAAIASKTHSQIPNLLQELDFEANSDIVEILRIDQVDTPALTLALNEYTETLFNDEDWVRDHPGIGEDKIRIGRGMASLP